MPFLLSSGVHVWISVVPPMCLSLDILKGDWLICYKEQRPAVQFRNTHSAKQSQAPFPQWAFTSNHCEQKLKNESNCLGKKIQWNRISKVWFEYTWWFFFFVWSSLSTSLALPFKMHNHLRLCCHSLCELLKSLWRTFSLKFLTERRISFAWQRASQHALFMLILPERNFLKWTLSPYIRAANGSLLNTLLNTNHYCS